MNELQKSHTYEIQGNYDIDDKVSAKGGVPIIKMEI